jgi:hypothetical protein
MDLKGADLSPNYTQSQAVYVAELGLIPLPATIFFADHFNDDFFAKILAPG